MASKSEYPPLREVFNHIVEITRFYLSIDRYYTIFRWIESLIQGVQMIVGFAILGLLMQSVAKDIATNQAITQSTLMLVVIALVVLGLTKGIAEVYAGWRRDLFNIEVERRMKDTELKTLLSLDLGRLWDPAFATARSKLSWRGLNAHSQLESGARFFVGNCFGGVLALGILFTLDPVLIIFALLPILPSVLSTLNIDARARALWDALELPRRQRDSYSDVLTGPMSLTQAKLQQSAEFFFSRYFSLNEDVIRSEREAEWYEMRSKFAVLVILLVCYAAAIYVIGQRLIGGAGFTEIMVIAASVQKSSNALITFGSKIAELKGRARDYGYYTDYISTKPLIDEKGAGDITMKTPVAIEVDKVTYAYPGQAGRALDECSLTIGPGEKVAIVGRNGSGKTTLARHILKVVAPRHGTIKIGGMPLMTVTQKSLVRHMAYVTQDVSIPEVPLHEAIAACAEHEVDRERLRRAAEIVGLVELIDRLPNGLRTMLDPTWPGGIRLSGGQEQRLRLLATLYRLFAKDIHIVLFDEPMSHCDVETREQFYQSVVRIPEKTIITIAHDPLYLALFERVIVMDQGKIIADLRGHEAISDYQDTLIASLSQDVV